MAFIVVGLDLGDLARDDLPGIRGEFQPVGPGFLVLDVLIAVLAVGVLHLDEIATGSTGLDRERGILAQGIVGLAQFAAVGTEESKERIEP